MKKIFNLYDVEAKEIRIGNKNVRGCIGCDFCVEHDGSCVFNDLVNEASAELKEASGLVVASPVYYGSPNGTIISFLDRLFYSANYGMKMKVGASFAIARRGGTSTTFDVLNKYFTISGMPIASGDYWNNGFGSKKGEILEDKEGLRNARVVAQRMVFLMKAINDAKDKYKDLLIDENRDWTNFIK